MSEENKAIMRRFYEAMNKGDLSIIDELAADDLVDHDEMAKAFPPGKEGARQMFQMMLAAFPDMKMEAHEMVAEGDKVFVLGTMTGTHKGDFMGMAATGKRVAVPMADLVRFKDGKAAEHWGVTDGGVLLQQLGVVEGP